MQELHYTLRNLRKTPSFTLVAICTLALGIGANAVAFAVVKTVLLNPLPYGEPERLVTVVESDSHTPNAETVSAATALDVKRQTSSFDQLSLWQDWSVRPLQDGKGDMLRGMRVSASFFETLGVRMFRGRSFLPDDIGRQVVILTYDTWMGRFGGDARLVGSSIQAVDGAYTVLGVLPPAFHSLHMSNPAELPRVFLLVGSDVERSACRASSCRGFRAIGRLQPGVTLAQARGEAQALMRRLVHEHPADYPQDANFVITPLRDHLVGQFRPALWMIEAAVLLLLLLACANVATLLLARTLTREHEMGIRAALGATRHQLMRQLLTESVVLATGAGAIGVSMAWAATRLIARTGDPNLPRIAELAPDRSMLLFAGAASLVTAVVFGLVPALVASGGAATRLRVGQGATARPFYKVAARGLIAIELALAFVVVLVVGLLSKSYLRILHVDPGFDSQNVLTVSLLPAEIARPLTLKYFDAVVDRTRAIPGVDDSGYASTLPLSHPFTRRLYVREHPIVNDTEAPNLDLYLVSSNYLAVMRIPVLRGRGFSVGDVDAAQAVAVISESSARMVFRGENAIGQHIQVGRRDDRQPWAVIVGVVGDVHQYGLDRQADSAVYLPFAQHPTQGWASLVVRSTFPTEHLESAVRAAMVEVDPLQPVFHLQPMTTYISLSVAQRTFTLTIIAVFGGLALLLATAGVFGVVSYLVEQRTREVGLRLALGASPNVVQRMIFRHVLTSAAAGVMLGFAVAVAVGDALSTLLFEVSPLDLATVGGVAVLLMVAATLASYQPISRVARVDPVVALKSE